MAKSLVHEWDYTVDPATDPHAEKPWGYWNQPVVNQWNPAGFWELQGRAEMWTMYIPWKYDPTDPDFLSQFQKSVDVEATMMIADDSQYNRRHSGLYIATAWNNFSGFRLAHLDDGRWLLSRWDSYANYQGTEVKLAEVKAGTSPFGTPVPTMQVGEKRTLRFSIEVSILEGNVTAKQIHCYVDGVKIFDLKDQRFPPGEYVGCHPYVFVYGNKTNFYKLRYLSGPGVVLEGSGFAFPKFYHQGTTPLKYDNSTVIKNPIRAAQSSRQGHRFYAGYFKSGTVRGTVKVKNKPFDIPVRRWVYLNTRTPMRMIDAVMSNEDGSFQFDEVSCNPEIKYFVTSFDTETGFLAVINDNVKVVMYPHDKEFFSLSRYITPATSPWGSDVTVTFTTDGRETPPLKWKMEGAVPSFVKSFDTNTGRLVYTQGGDSGSVTVVATDATGLSASDTLEVVGKTPLISKVRFNSPSTTDEIDLIQNKTVKSFSATISNENMLFGEPTTTLSYPRYFGNQAPAETWAFGTDDFLIRFWLRIADAGDCFPIAQQNSSGGPGWAIHRGFSGQWIRMIHSGDEIVSAKWEVPYGNWAHICFSRKNGVARSFMNGVKGGEQPYSKFIVSATDWLHYGTRPGGDYWLNGSIADVEIFKGYGIDADFAPPTKRISAT